MPLNRIQQRIFSQLCAARNMVGDAYIATYCREYLDKDVSCLAELTEEDADIWITRAYLQTL